MKDGWEMSHFSHAYYNVTDEDVLAKEIKKQTIHTGNATISGIDLSVHAWKRWNERVGPSLSYQECKQIMRTLIVSCKRIEFVNHQFAILDDEIVVIYERNKKTDTLCIVTFYGRISVLPFLMNIEALRKFNLRNDEHINLKINQRILNEQLTPPIPKEVVYYQQKKSKLMIEKYCTTNGEKIVVKKINSNGEYYAFVMDMNEPNTTINRQILEALEKLGYNTFVERNKAYFQKRFEEKQG